MRKNYATIATINIGTLRDKQEEIAEMMKEKKIKILGLAETRQKGRGRRTIHDNYELINCGNPHDSKGGVALVLEEKLANCIENIRYENNRILAITLNINQHKISIIQAYAPQQGRPAEEKAKFYEDLENVYDHIPVNSDIIVMGDLNGHVGSEVIPGTIGIWNWPTKRRRRTSHRLCCKKQPSNNEHFL